MSLVKIVADNAATPSTILTDLVSLVQEDPASVASGIKARVDAAKDNGTVVMMGGWTD